MGTIKNRVFNVCTKTFDGRPSLSEFKKYSDNSLYCVVKTLCLNFGQLNSDFLISIAVLPYQTYFPPPDGIIIAIPKRKMHQIGSFLTLV